MDAQREFERASSLDPDFPGAQVGMALVAMEQQDFWRARQEVAKALHKDGRFTDGYIALGRIATAEGVQRGYPVETWSKEALDAYKRAAERDPDNPAVPYYRGRCLLEAMQLEAARASFAEALKKARGPWIKRTQDELERAQLIERVAPGSSWGLKIALLPRITRAELAVLLIEELNLDEMIRQRRVRPNPPGFRDPSHIGGDTLAQATDLSSSWARPWIEQILKLGVGGLETTPDHRFQPGMAIDRASMAVVTQGILVLLTGDQDLATRYLGEASRFPDVRSDSYAYSAIALNAERGVITADQLSGLFHPEGPVSGAEALQIIRQLQNAVRLDF
ncbi:MAG: tetratricopeptide repeat protein [Candidatus Latescibacteria bacterium]|nr:tetratricopeptide repeat protein [Candidatus Latescibacterota bacterium]